MTTTANFLALGRLTNLRFNALQLQMSQLCAKESRLQQNLEDLLSARASRVRTMPDQSDTALAAGADVPWYQWVDQRRALINAELATILAKKEQCRINLQFAFGRDQAAAALIKRNSIAQKAILDRRGHYES